MDAAQLSAWVLDGGVRFVPPQNEYNEWGGIKTTSKERKVLSDDDVRTVLPTLSAAVEIDLTGCGQLTDAPIIEIARGCPQLQSLDVRCVGASACALALTRLTRLFHSVSGIAES